MNRAAAGRMEGSKRQPVQSGRQRGSPAALLLPWGKDREEGRRNQIHPQSWSGASAPAAVMGAERHLSELFQAVVQLGG